MQTISLTKDQKVVLLAQMLELLDQVLAEVLDNVDVSLEGSGGRFLRSEVVFQMNGPVGRRRPRSH